MNTPHRPTPTGQHAQQILALFVLVSLTVAAVIPLQKRLAGRMEQIQTGIIDYLETATGREITYGRFSPSILRYLEIRDMRMLPEEPGAEPLLAINRIRIYFNLWSVIRGELAESLRRISIEDTTFTVDREKDRDLLTLVSRLAAPTTESTPLPTGSGFEVPAGIVISGKNLTVSATFDGTTLTATELFFDLTTGVSDDSDLELSTDLAAIIGAELGLPETIDSASTSVNLAASIAPGFQELQGMLTLSRLTTPVLELTEQTFEIRTRKESWTLRKVQDRLPIDLELIYLTGERTISGTVAMEGLSPSSLGTPLGQFAQFAEYLDIELTGNGTGGIELDTGAINYRAALSAQIPVPFLEEPVALETAFTGTDTYIEIDRLMADSTEGSISYSGSVGFGSLQPQGVIEIDRVTYPLGRPVSANGTFSFRDGTVRFDSPVITIGEESISDLSLTLVQEDDRADFTIRLSVAAPEDFVAEGTALFGDERSFDLAASLGTTPAARLYRLVLGSEAELPLPGLIEELGVGFDLFVQSDFDRFAFSIPSLVVENGERTRSARITASGNNDEIRISEIEAVWDDQLASGQATIALEGEGLASATGSVRFRDQQYALSAQYDAETGIFLTGDYELNAAISIGADANMFRLTCAELPIPIGEQLVWVSAEAGGSIVSVDSFQIDLRSLTLSGLPFPADGVASVGISGRITEADAAITELTVSDAFSTVSGSVDLQYEFGDTLEVVALGVLTHETTGERYRIDGSISSETIDARVILEHSPLDRFGDLPVVGRVSGDATLSGAVDSPSFAGSFSIADGRLNEGSIDASVRVELTNRFLSVRDLSVDLRSSRIRDGRLTLDFADSTFSGGTGFAGILQNQTLTSDIELDGRFSAPIDRSGLFKLVDADFDAVAAARSVVLGEPERADWVFDVARRGETITIGGGIGESVQGTINLDGSFDVLLGDPLPVTMSASGRVAEGEIEAILSTVRLDMEGVDSIVTIPFFNIASGTATSGNTQLRIAGPLNDPDMFGELEARDLVARVPVVPESIGPFDARLSFQGKKLVIDEALLPIGKGAVKGYVDFTIDHWLPKTYEIELVTDPANRNGLHVQYNFGSIEVDGYANGVLTVTGDEIATILKGDLAIRNTDIQLGEPIESDGEEGEAGMIVDLRFTTDRQVTFYWPSERLPVLRSNAETGQVLHLTSNSLNGSLSIDGDISVRGGDIFYFKRNFYIREGQIRFQEDENRFDPFITARAEAKDRTEDGEDLTLYLIVENQPFSQFSPRFESDPPMASIDILTRLGRTIVQDPAGDPSFTSAVLLTTDILSQFGIFRNVEQQVRNFLQLDLFSLRTQIIQNIITDNVFPTGADPVATQPSIGRYLDNTTLFLGKYFGNDLFLEAMFRLKSNQALLTSADADDRLSVDSEIRLEWQTPLFLLEFSMLPDLADPLASITRSSIGLSWNF